MVGFTATPLKEEAHASDKHLLDMYNIFVHDSCIPGMMNPGQEDLSVIDWDSFCNNKQPRVARLVYVPKVDKLDEKLQNLPEHLSIV